MKGYIVLETGEIFEGSLHGPEQEVHGEIVFFTGVTGYQEVLSDPSFKGQMVVFTYPLLGNYGINENDFESLQAQASALIVSEVNETGYHYEASMSLTDCCLQMNLPLVTDVDTRAIVKRIREHGDMRAVLTTKPEQVDFANARSLAVEDVVPKVSTKDILQFGSGDSHIVMVDFGYKKSIVEHLLSQHYKVTVVPHDSSLEEIEQLAPDGILLSNGPGNPKRLEALLPTVQALAKKYPTLGICLGHQLLALAFGANTEKLTFGHRGANQPVLDLQTNKVYMTSQNHSYVVKEESLAGTGLCARFININDRSIEGLTHEAYPIVSIQFHPEAHPGPGDTTHLFELFFEMVSRKGREKAYA